MGIINGIIQTFNSLTMWLPSYMSTLLSACFLVFAASFFLKVIINFVHVLGRVIL